MITKRPSGTRRFSATAAFLGWESSATNSSWSHSHLVFTTVDGRNPGMQWNHANNAIFSTSPGWPDFWTINSIFAIEGSMSEETFESHCVLQLLPLGWQNLDLRPSSCLRIHAEGDDILVGGCQPTHLKNMFVKLGSSSPFLGVKIKKYSKLPLGIMLMQIAVPAFSPLVVLPSRWILSLSHTGPSWSVRLQAWQRHSSLLWALALLALETSRELQEKKNRKGCEVQPQM